MADGMDMSPTGTGDAEQEADKLLKDRLGTVVEEGLQQINTEKNTIDEGYTENVLNLDEYVEPVPKEDSNQAAENQAAEALIQLEEYKLKYLAAREVIKKLARGKNVPSTTTKQDEGSVETLQARVAELEDKLLKQGQKFSELQLKGSGEPLRARVAELEEDLVKEQQKFSELHRKKVELISDLLKSVSKAERREARARLQQESLKFGKVVAMRTETSPYKYGWEDGQQLADLRAEHNQLMEDKADVKNKLGLLKTPGAREGYLNAEDFEMQQQVLEIKLENISREEERIRLAKDRFIIDRSRHILEKQRVQHEDESAFNNFPIMKNRYLLLNLLGKGGFGEVYKAYDLMEYKYVACKFHVIDLQQTQERQDSYIRHARRECGFQSSLKHGNIVQLLDTFDIDNNKFCAVLEYCGGGNLEDLLRSSPVLTEQEARVHIIQILRALVYLNQREKKIIHFDLKPANILFNEFGAVKITDFGLSKAIDIGCQDTVLTSEGAGTYWYLPPECFMEGARISSKVDVWSAGVLLYQMLYGKRPFSHDISAATIWHEKTILNAVKLDFPESPPISDGAKGFIRRCLTYKQNERPDVIAISKDPYLHYNTSRK